MVSKQDLIDILQENDTTSGTTTDDYSDGLDWECGILVSKTIFLKNTHTSAGLYYKVLTYAFKDGIEYEELPETALDAGDLTQVNLSYPYGQVKIQVKSETAGSPATYTIDYTGVMG